MKKDTPLTSVIALSPEQVGAMIGFSERTVYDMIAGGELPCRLIRGSRRVLRADLERWLDTQELLVPGERGVA
jgi:excisionase family DNA binding protein